MKKYFITYGDTLFEDAKRRIIVEAKLTGEFDYIIAYDHTQVTEKLKQSDIFAIKRGGGLWSWKPDIILSTMEKAHIGDIIVYCDAGCSLYPSYEWGKIWKKFENSDIIAQRIFTKTQQWTRKEIVDYFIDNGRSWLSQYQYQATILLKVTDFTREFINEWRNLMIEHPEFVMDVSEEKLSEQMVGFIENRHDQAIYSALIYKYLNNPKTKDKIYTQWEHIEDYDPFCKQAIRATRLRHGQEETSKAKFVAGFKRIIKDFIYKPLYYAPLQWWYSKLL